MSGQETSVVFGITRKSLEAIVIHACPHCGAPGVYREDQRTQEHWPGCWDPLRKDKHVGEQCPNCNRTRKADKDLGELTASMPRWMWNTILAAKWCYLKIARRRRANARYGQLQSS